MPILIPRGLPAYRTLKNENIFVMHERRGSRQDIRPLRIAIVNLMPTKQVTETQLARMLANTPLQVQLFLLRMESHFSTHVDESYMRTFYTTFEEIKSQKFDGMIITGAPVEFYDFEDVDYWDELSDLMDYSKKNVFSTLHVCWGAQAGLYHHYEIKKYELPQKLFGVFPHRVLDKKSEFTRGFDDVFYVPHSRHTQIRKEEVLAEPDLEILAESEEAGPHIICSRNKRMLFIQGHMEYDRDTLRLEYERDLGKGLPIAVPANYFKNDDPAQGVEVRWTGHANLFFANWLNYVYQETPFDLERLPEME